MEGMRSFSVMRSTRLMHTRLSVCIFVNKYIHSKTNITNTTPPIIGSVLVSLYDETRLLLVYFYVSFLIKMTHLVMTGLLKY